MPRRNVEQLFDWIARESPSDLAELTARRFLDEVAEESWRHPSVPLAELSDQPVSEMRRAELPVSGEDRPVIVWYRHFYANDDIDVVGVTNL